MKFFRNHIVFRSLCFLLALHILNCCVDVSDPQPENVAEDLSYNDQESMVEIVLEQVLQIDNAIHEYDDHDTDNSGGLVAKKGHTFFVVNNLPVNKISQSEFQTNHFPEYQEQLSSQFRNEIVAPPPKG